MAKGCHSTLGTCLQLPPCPGAHPCSLQAHWVIMTELQGNSSISDPKCREARGPVHGCPALHCVRDRAVARSSCCFLPGCVGGWEVPATVCESPTRPPACSISAFMPKSRNPRLPGMAALTQPFEVLGKRVIVLTFVDAPPCPAGPEAHWPS